MLLSFSRLLFGLILVLLCACVSASDAKTSNALRELGLSYLHEGNTEGALRELIKARDLNPRDARIRHELGLAFFAKGIFDQAEVELRRAVRLDPSLSEARLNLASLYIAQERYPEAEVQLKKVLEDYLYRSPARAHTNLGWVYYKQKRYDDALRAYDQALRIAPRFCQTLYNVSTLFSERGQLDMALTHAERAVEACPEDMRYRLMLGEVQISLGRGEEAAANLEAVVQREGSSALGVRARELLSTLR